jgi:Xaa-Pro aminopeptidase
VSKVTSTALPPLEVAGRIGRLRRALGQGGEGNQAVDALLVTNPVNIRWLTGFSGSAGLLLIGANRALLTTDGRYRSQSAEQLAAVGLDDEVEVAVGGVAVQREAVVGATPGDQALGLEADHVTWSGERAWAGLLPAVELVPTSGLVERLRAVKDPGELARMARAASIADEALGEVLPLLAEAARPGGSITEARFAAALDHAMREGGAEERAFETIVAAGEDSAKPHARPTDRSILAGDPVVVDFGAVFDGYRSDMTRTFFIGGEPSGEMGRVFEVVAEAQRAGVASVRPGIAAGEVDEVCRDVIAAAGWKERFEHGTGHGVGLDIHEAPSVAPGSTAILEPGTVVTVEPGVYLPGFGGVRIEDTLVVTDDGCRPLTTFPKEVAL